MAERRDYYEVLGIERSADGETIKKAYRKLAMEWHPDRNADKPDAEERFKEISEAYAVLSDSEKRARYDRFGHVGAGAGGFGGAGMDIDPFEIFRSFMGGFGFGDIFGGPAGSSGGRGPRTYRGKDLQIRMPLTLEEIAEGVSKKIKVQRFESCSVCEGSGAKEGTEPETCPTCKGAGEVQQVTRSFIGQVVNITVCSECRGRGKIIRDTCDHCRGEGRVRNHATLEIKVPEGVRDGNYMTLHGEGHAGPWNGPSGDLAVVFEEKEHEHFERHEDDILYSMSISVPEAVLGAEVDVPTLNGPLTLEIPPGVQPGKVLRMRGKGIPHLNERGSGDQLVQVNVYIPEKPSAEAKQLFEKLSGEEGVEPKKRGQKGFFRKVRDTFFGAE